MSDTVKAFRDYLPSIIPLRHPSWRNTGWLNRNQWFASDLLPVLRGRVQPLLALPGRRSPDR